MKNKRWGGTIFQENVTPFNSTIPTNHSTHLQSVGEQINQLTNQHQKPWFAKIQDIYQYISTVHQVNNTTQTNKLSNP